MTDLIAEEQLGYAGAKVIVCDDFNYEDALELVDNGQLTELKHVVVIGSEGKAQGAIPIK